MTTGGWTTTVIAGGLGGGLAQAAIATVASMSKTRYTLIGIRADMDGFTDRRSGRGTL